MKDKTCNCCNETFPIDGFPLAGKYKNKHGKTVKYYRDTCKACFAGKMRLKQRSKEYDEFNRLVGWPATMLSALLIVTGIYSHDYIKGSNRICFYDSVVGSHAVTIDAMKMCPLTWEFEV